MAAQRIVTPNRNAQLAPSATCSALLSNLKQAQTILFGTPQSGGATSNPTTPTTAGGGSLNAATAGGGSLNAAIAGTTTAAANNVANGSQGLLGSNGNPAMAATTLNIWGNTSNNNSQVTALANQLQSAIASVQANCGCL